MLKNIVKAILANLEALLTGEPKTLTAESEIVNLGALGSFKVTESVTIQKIIATEAPASNA